MGIYDELRKSLNIAVDTVNNYSFSKKEDNRTIQNELKNKFNNVISARIIAASNFRKLVELREKAFSTLLSISAAQYYYNNIKNDAISIEKLSKVVSALTSSSALNSNYNINVILSNLKTALTENNTKEIQKYGVSINNIFTLVKEGFGYEDGPNKLTMKFDVSNVDSPSTANVKSFDSITSINWRYLTNNEVFKYNKSYYKLNHQLVYNTGASTADSLSYSLDNLDADGFSSNIVFDPSKNLLKYISNNATRTFNLANDINIKNSIFGRRGTINQPYVISSAADLKQYSGENPVIKTTENTYFLILNDINLAEADSIFPLGKYYGDCTITAGISTSKLNGVFKPKDNNETDDEIRLRFSNSIKVNIGNTKSVSGTMDNSQMQLLSEVNVPSGKYTVNLLRTSNDNSNTTVYTSSADMAISGISSIQLTINSIDDARLIITASGIQLEYRVFLNENAVIDDISDSRYKLVFYLGDLSRLANYDREKSGDNPNVELTDIQFMPREVYITMIIYLESILKDLRNDSLKTLDNIYRSIYNNALSFISLESNRKENSSIYNDEYITEIISAFSNIVAQTNGLNLDSVKAFLIGKGTDISITLPSISIPGINAGGATTPGTGDNAHTLEMARHPALQDGNGKFTSLGNSTDGTTINGNITTADLFIGIMKIYSTEIAPLINSIEPAILSVFDDILKILEPITTIIDQYTPFFSNSLDPSTKNNINLKKDLSIFYSLSSTSKTPSFISFPKRIRSYAEWDIGMAKYSNDGIYNLSLIYIGYELMKNLIDDDELNSEYLDRSCQLVSFALRNGLSKSLWKKELFDPDYIVMSEYEGILWEKAQVKVIENPKNEHVLASLTNIAPSISILNNLDISSLYNGTIDIQDAEYKRIIDILSMFFIKDISNTNNMVNTATSIMDVFNRTDLNFKMLIAKRAFIAALKKLNDKSTGNNEYSYILANIDTLNESTGFYGVDELIMMYHVVWLFKYSINTEMINYINENNNSGKSLIEYLNQPKEDISVFKDEKELTTKIDKNKIRDLWQKLVNSVKLIFEGLKI